MSSITNKLWRSRINAEEPIQGAFDHLPDEQRLPTEMILHIFSFLPLEDLARASGVCRDWCILANDDILWKRFDLNKVFPSLSIIDRTVWKRCVHLAAFDLSFEDAEPVDNRELIPALKHHLHHLAEAKIEKNAGWTLVELPKGLNFNKLIALASSPKQGNITSFRYIYEPVLKQFGECSVSKTYRFMITNNVLERSRDLHFDGQQDFEKKVECEMPGFLEAASLMVLTHMNGFVA